MKITAFVFCLAIFLVFYFEFFYTTFDFIKLLFMSYEMIGKLIAKFDIVQRTETFKTREFVIEKSEDIGGRVITNYAKFQCVQDKTNMPDRFNIGDEVKVMFNIKGTKWNKSGVDNYITNLDAWRMETVKINTDNSFNDAPQVFVPSDAPGDIVDDLPF